MNWEAIVWFALVLLFALVEANTVALVSAWFAIGSLGAMIVALLGGPLWLQILVFFTVSAVLLAGLRPVVNKYLKPRLTRTNVDSVLGTQGVVLEDIDNLASSGRVKLGSLEWSARSTTGEPIVKSTIVRVDRVEGVKVFVTEVK